MFTLGPTFRQASTIVVSNCHQLHSDVFSKFEDTMSYYQTDFLK